ncbi:hypothetical protein KR044_001319 [Drosophila immigrans]|nr:hypothetical protein KR044_001319 [Drosophila immigrans]
MTSIGCVAKLLANFEMNSCFWVERVNPNWHQARQVPNTLLNEKSRDNYVLKSEKDNYVRTTEKHSKSRRTTSFKKSIRL